MVIYDSQKLKKSWVRCRKTKPEYKSMSEEQKMKCFHKVNVKESLCLLGEFFCLFPYYAASYSVSLCVLFVCNTFQSTKARSLTAQQYVFILFYSKQGEGTRERTDGRTCRQVVLVIILYCVWNSLTFFSKGTEKKYSSKSTIVSKNLKAGNVYHVKMHFLSFLIY